MVWENLGLSRLQKILKFGFTFGKSYSGQRTKGMATKPFAEDIGCVTHGSTTQPSQHKSRIEMDLMRKDL